MTQRNALIEAAAALEQIKARNAAARRDAIQGLPTYWSQTLGRRVTIPESSTGGTR